MAMTLLAVVAALLAGVTVLLFVPVRARVAFDTEAPERRLRWRVRWALLAFSSDSRRRARRPKKPPKPREPRRSSGDGGRRARAALAAPGLARRAARLVREELAAVRPQDAEVVLRIGLEDPASTGILFGRVMAVAAAVPPAWRVRVEPDFEEPTLRARGEVAWSVPPARVLWPVATFLAAPSVWRAARAAWRVPSGRRL